MKTTSEINGLDTTKMFETVEAIKARPDLARFEFRASNRWIQGGENLSTIRDFYGAGQEDTSRKRTFQLEADEPAALLGEDFGPNATEGLLHALASCLGTTLIYHATARGVPIRSMNARTSLSTICRGGADFTST